MTLQLISGLFQTRDPTLYTSLYKAHNDFRAAFKTLPSTENNRRSERKKPSSSSLKRVSARRRMSGLLPRKNTHPGSALILVCYASSSGFAWGSLTAVVMG